MAKKSADKTLIKSSRIQTSPGAARQFQKSDVPSTAPFSVEASLPLRPLTHQRDVPSTAPFFYEAYLLLHPPIR